MRADDEHFPVWAYKHPPDGARALRWAETRDGADFALQRRCGPVLARLRLDRSHRCLCLVQHADDEGQDKGDEERGLAEVAHACLRNEKPRRPELTGFETSRLGLPHSTP